MAQVNVLRKSLVRTSKTQTAIECVHQLRIRNIAPKQHNTRGAKGNFKKNNMGLPETIHNSMHEKIHCHAKSFSASLNDVAFHIHVIGEDVEAKLDGRPCV
jgi:hypothetical protein